MKIHKDEHTSTSFAFAGSTSELSMLLPLLMTKIGQFMDLGEVSYFSIGTYTLWYYDLLGHILHYEIFQNDTNEN